jgi:hypothetical protein
MKEGAKDDDAMEARGKSFGSFPVDEDSDDSDAIEGFEVNEIMEDPEVKEYIADPLTVPDSLICDTFKYGSILKHRYEEEEEEEDDVITPNNNTAVFDPKKIHATKNFVDTTNNDYQTDKSLHSKFSEKQRKRSACSKPWFAYSRSKEGVRGTVDIVAEVTPYKKSKAVSSSSGTRKHYNDDQEVASAVKRSWSMIFLVRMMMMMNYWHIA